MDTPIGPWITKARAQLATLGDRFRRLGRERMARGRRCGRKSHPILFALQPSLIESSNSDERSPRSIND